ncbi:MAG: DoxX family protein [Lysobacteraceae bacterium]
MTTPAMSFTPVAPSVAWAATLLRVALGTMYVAHALLKLLVFTLPGTAQFFVSVGLPGVLAYPVFAAELLGGIALLLGLHARVVAPALIPVLLGAAWVHLPNGWVFNAPGGGWEYPIFLAVVAVAVALLGDWRLAVRRAAGRAVATG